MSKVGSILAADPVHLRGSGHGVATTSDTAAQNHHHQSNCIAEPPTTPDHTSQTVQDRSHPREHGRSPGREESRRAARRRSIDLVAEAEGDVEAFVQALELKRKQLDEQIHKFIAQKEREFKRYEQEVRRQYQTAHLMRPLHDDSQLHVTVQSPTSPLDSEYTPTSPRASVGEVERVEDLENVRSRIDRRSANSGLEDIRPSYEREKDFMGLFTPSFLPLLDGKPDIERSPSAPNLTDNRGAPLLADRQVLQRAHTEPLLDANGNPRPRQYPRTPSSGSDGLVSALKSAGGRKNPKSMRVMLQLADDQPAVHPNDDLPTDREYAPVRQAEAMHHSKSAGSQLEEDSPVHSPSISPKPTETNRTQDTPATQKLSGLTQGLSSRPKAAATPIPEALSIDKSADFEDLASPFPLDEDVYEPQQAAESDWEVDYQEDIAEDVEARSPSLSVTPAMERSESSPSSTANPSENLGLPLLKIRSSSSSSTQPISPGFSRPSVREDPVFDSAFLEDEQAASSVVGQGSYYDAFARPSLSGRGTLTGSLGESFMQRNAEALMRRKRP